MKSLQEELLKHIEGEVHFDSMTRCVYSVDASIFEVNPLAIVIPKNKEDLIKAVKIAYAHHIPITVRGAATGITGGCLGKGLIIDTSKYLNHILSIDVENKRVICEPGVVQDDLNAALAPYGYRLGPDTSTGNRATLGGMLGNNAAGARSLRFGRMIDHVQEVELLLANGQLIHFGPISKAEWMKRKELDTVEGHIYQTVWDIKENYISEIQKHFPNIPRRVSGYNLDELIKDESINLSKLIVGSGGTLGIVTSMTLDIVPKIKASGICLLHFDDIIKGMQNIREILNFNPMALEIIDDQIIELGRASPSLRGQLEWLQGNPKAILIIEFDGENDTEVKNTLQQFSREMQAKNIGYAPTILLELSAISKVWALRKSGLGVLLSKRTYSRAIAFIEDFSVSPYRLADFMKEFVAYLESKGKKAGIYGHVGSGCMHVRPYVDLRQPEEIELMHQIMIDVADLLLKYGGALSGEHGDGLIRSWLLPRMFGERIMQAFKELKDAFDPIHLMNPGKVVNATPPLKELRLSPEVSTKIPEVFLNFSKEGGFALAVDLCNGNGQCRKKEGVMCPSFQVTKDEFHSTRARAQALRSIIHGRLPMKDFTSKNMYEVMDLCISCKGCKTECPSQVDMAKMKSEFLYHYQEKHGYSFRNRLFGNIGLLNKWASPFASLFNKLSRSPLSKKILNYFDIATERTLPALAKQKFSKWLKGYRQVTEKAKQVVLFNDTFNEFNEPEIGQAATKVLNALGFEVIVPKWNCCGRPAFSKGLLKQAHKKAKRVIETLLPYASKGLPIIGLEPSCILMIKDDYLGLFREEDSLLSKAKIVSSHCLTFDEFIANLQKEGHFNLQFKNQEQIVKVHGHCHQKALIGMKPTMDVLKAIPGFIASEIQSGCCGMAGSFGYEKEHYKISMDIGGLCLFPAVEKSSDNALIVANGTSCRHQIKDGVRRRALHLAEVIEKQMNY